MKTHILFFSIFLIFSLSATAQATYTWNRSGNGNWTNASHWSPSRTSPASNDILIIDNGGTKTISSVPTQTIGKLIIGGNTTITLNASGGTQTLTFTNGSGTELTVESGSTLIQNSNLENINLGANSSADISGTFRIRNSFNTNASNVLTTVTGTIENESSIVCNNASKLNFAAGSFYAHNRNGGSIPTATWNSSATILLSGITSSVPSGLNQSFGNFEWNNPGQSTGFNMGEAITSVTGDMIIANTNNYGLFMASNSSSTYSLSIGGDFVQSGSTWFSITNGDNITATMNVAGNFIFTSGYFDYHVASSGGTTLNTIVLNVDGDFTQTGGNFDFAYGNSNVANYTALNLKGNLSLTGSGIISTTTSDGDISNGVIHFNKPAGTQTFFAETPANISYANFDIANTSELQLQSDIILSSIGTAVWGGKFTVSGGGTLNLGTYRLSSSSGTSPGSNNAFTVAANGKIITANADGIQTDATNGSISTAIETVSFSSDADYEFQNAVTGIFSTTPAAGTVRDLIINNVSGNVVMNQPIAVSGTVTLSSGILFSTLTNLLTINDNATATGGSYSPARFVNGPVRKIGNDAFTFPIGKDGIYAPSTISAPGAVNAEYRSEYYRGAPPNRFNITAPGLSHISFCEYWDVEEVGPGSPVVDVTLSWSGLSPCNPAAYITDISTLTVAHYDGANWNSHNNNGGVVGSAILGAVTRNTVSSFSIFTIGSTSAATNPLSVKFSAVKAYQAGPVNKIEWTNSAEEGVVHYEVQQSSNGVSFATINQVQARSNNGSRENYTITDDNPGTGVTFYRIKAQELSGELTYSSIVKVIRNAAFTDKLQIYPNPVVNKQFSLLVSGQQGLDYHVKLFNTSGQEVYQTQFKHTGGVLSTTVNLPTAIQSGMYFLQLTGDGRLLQSRLLIQ